MTGRRRLTLLLGGVVAVAAVIAVIVESTDAIHLREAMVDDIGVLPPQDVFEQSGGALPLYRVPIGSIAEELLANDRVFRVTVRRELPNRLVITRNEFAIAVAAIDRASGLPFGMTLEGRVVPLHVPLSSLTYPLFTRVDVGPVYGRCRDSRAVLMLQQLVALHAREERLVSLISELDFGDPEFVRVTFDGLPITVAVDERSFAHRWPDFIRFVDAYLPGSGSSGEYDLRWPELIVHRTDEERRG